MVDVQKLVCDGENELSAEIENEWGQAGFVLRLVLTDANGQNRFLVTDRVAGRHGAMAVRGKRPRWWASMARNPGKNRLEFRVADGQFHALPGFQVERLFTVPKNQLGFMGLITTDGKGRLLVSDQDRKGLCRVTPPPSAAPSRPRSSALTRRVRRPGHAVGLRQFVCRGQRRTGERAVPRRDTEATTNSTRS